jgi:DNA-binding NarL/FixJ family response regulator
MPLPTELSSAETTTPVDRASDATLNPMKSVLKSPPEKAALSAARSINSPTVASAVAPAPTVAPTPPAVRTITAAALRGGPAAGSLQKTSTAAAPKPSGKSRVLLVDDHPLTRHGMKALISQQPNLEIVGEADSAPRALELVEKLKPNLAIVDITLRSTNGIELTKGMRAQSPDLQVLIVSMHDENLYAERALRAGAMGYLMKHEASEKIITAIQRIQQGEIYLSDRIKEKMLHRFVNHKTDELVSPIDTLSDREMEVFQLIGNGYGTRLIAQQLNLSIKTIDSYREHLKLKLNLESGSELVRYAIQWMKSQGTM